MVTKLGFHRALDHPDRGTKNDFVKLAHHFAAATVAQCPAFAASWATGTFLTDLGAVGAVFNRLLQLIAFGFGVNEDMTGRGSCHEILLNGQVPRLTLSIYRRPRTLYGCTPFFYFLADKSATLFGLVDQGLATTFA